MDEKKLKFIKEYNELCKKHGLIIQGVSSNYYETTLVREAIVEINTNDNRDRNFFIEKGSDDCVIIDNEGKIRFLADGRIQ